MSKHPRVAVIADGIIDEVIPPAKNVFALFIDLMGFASAIDSLTDEELISLRNQLTLPDMYHSSSARTAQLAQRYWDFHNAVRPLSQVGSRSLSYISFSDSVVLALANWSDAKTHALDLMHHLLQRQVPERIGIGYGTFERLTFSIANTPSGALVAEAPFYGTAILRAYRAHEAKSCKGFRIILHPSVPPLASDPAHVVVPLDVKEASTDCSHELNLLFNRRTGGYWDMRGYKKALKSMRRGVSDARALAHYDRMLDIFASHQQMCIANVPGALTPKKS